MTVVLTTAAKADLVAIGDYISADNPSRALSFVEELVDSCMSLDDMPRGFPLVPRYERQGIRRRAHGRYLIFYCIREEVIDVVHILHSARDYESLLSAEM